MQMGLALLREVNLPIQLTSPEGIPFKDWMASEESRREGYYEFYRLIQSLGKVKELPKGTEPEAWSIPTRPPPPKIE